MRYALFDFDGTLIHGDSIVSFLFYARRKRSCSLFRVLCAGVSAVLYSTHLISAEHSKTAAMRFLKGRDPAQVKKLAHGFCRDVLIPNLYPQGVDEIRLLKEQGIRVLLISASTGFYLEPLKEYLGLETILSTQMETDENGVFTGRLQGRNCRGNEKVHRLTLWLRECGDTQPVFEAGYGDTRGDAPMMELCARRIGVDPKPALVSYFSGKPGFTAVHWDPAKGGKA